MRDLTRVTVIVTVAAASALVTVAPAMAEQFYKAPGFASGNASCVGSTSTFSAHYGEEGQSFPEVVHGSVGPAVSADATTYPAGTVGTFNSALAQNHGSVLVCVP